MRAAAVTAWASAAVGLAAAAVATGVDSACHSFGKDAFHRVPDQLSCGNNNNGDAVERVLTRAGYKLQPAR
jgi:hypothetical protein